MQVCNEFTYKFINRVYPQNHINPTKQQFGKEGIFWSKLLQDHELGRDVILHAIYSQRFHDKYSTYTHHEYVEIHEHP